MSQGFAVPLNLPLSVNLGGTGLTAVAEGALLRGGAGNTVTTIAPEAENYVLTMGATNPAWSQRINKAALPQDAAGVTWDTVGALVISRATSFLSTLLVTLQLSLGAGTAANPAVRMGGVETGIFQATNTLGFSEAGTRRGSVVSGVWILGPGTAAGAAGADGLRVPGVSQFDAAVTFGSTGVFTGNLQTNASLVVTGNTPVAGANRSILANSTTDGILYVYGPDTSTRGGWVLNLNKSNGTSSIDVIVVSNVGGVTLPFTLTVTGASTFSSTGSFAGQLSLSAGTAANPGVRLGGVETGLFQVANTLGFSQDGTRRASVISGVWIFGAGTAAGGAGTDGIRVPGASQFDSTVAITGVLTVSGAAAIGRSALSWGGSFVGHTLDFLGLSLIGTSALDGRIFQNAYFNGTNYVTVDVGASCLVNFGGGEFLIYLAPSVAAGATIAAVERFYISNLGNFGINTTSGFGSGVGVIGIKNAATNPSTNPSGGGALYADAGALKWRGSSGTVTSIAPA